MNNLKILVSIWLYFSGLFMAVVTVLVGFNSILLLFPWHQLTFYFELMPFLFNETLRFRFILLCLPIVQLVFSLIIEVRFPIMNYFDRHLANNFSPYLDSFIVLVNLWLSLLLHSTCYYKLLNIFLFTKYIFFQGKEHIFMFNKI